jgi:hypothetical protein
MSDEKRKIYKVIVAVASQPFVLAEFNSRKSAENYARVYAEQMEIDACCYVKEEVIHE